MVLWIGLQFVIVEFHGHTHFLKTKLSSKKSCGGPYCFLFVYFHPFVNILLAFLSLRLEMSFCDCWMSLALCQQLTFLNNAQNLPDSV